MATSRVLRSRNVRALTPLSPPLPPSCPPSIHGGRAAGIAFVGGTTRGLLRDTAMFNNGGSAVEIAGGALPTLIDNTIRDNNLAAVKAAPVPGVDPGGEGGPVADPSPGGVAAGTCHPGLAASTVQGPGSGAAVGSGGQSAACSDGWGSLGRACRWRG